MRYFILLLLAAGLWIAAAATARAQELRVRDLPKHVGHTVTIHGTTGARIDSTDPTAPKLFNFADDYGDHVVVSTEEEYPITGATYRISGAVAKADDGTVYLNENSRERVHEGPPSPPPPSPVLIGLAVATGVVLVALLIVLIMIVTNRGGVTARPSPSEGSFVDVGTVKLIQPTNKAIEQGTVKVLPGRFELVEGDGTNRQIYLHATKDNPGKEFALTRLSNGTQPYSNAIYFKDQTVSAKQGKLLYNGDGSYTVFNFVDPTDPDRNAIAVNGKDLGMNSSHRLADGDAIQIGSTTLKYYAH